MKRELILKYFAPKNTEVLNIELMNIDKSNIDELQIEVYSIDHQKLSLTWEEIRDVLLQGKCYATVETERIKKELGFGDSE